VKAHEGGSQERRGEKAIADYTAALAIRPDLHEVLNSRGWAYCLKGDYTRGLENANKSLSICPDDANVLDTRATAYQGLGDLNRAIADWEEAVRLAPDNAKLRENLDKARASKGAKTAQDAGR